MRSSVLPLAPRVALRPRLPHARKVALIAAQLAFVAALLWFCLPQGFGGRADWVLVSGTSMLPHLHTGDVVLVDHQSAYHVGEVVAYRVPKGQVGAGYVVIHRIVGGNGRTGWTLQGDNRTAADLWHPTDRNVLGAKLLRIPDAWLALRFLHTPLFLGLLAGFGIFFWVAFGGCGDSDDAAGGAEEGLR
jgi:signal peptidase